MNKTTNKKSPAVLAIILLIILGGILYLKLSYEPPNPSELAETKKTLQELLLTPNQMCTFEINDQNSGTLYAAESNFRVDFTENDSATHLISDLTNVFLWFDGKDIGIRVAWPIELDNSELDIVATKILDLGITVESECSPWVVDSSKFELPDVDFKDFGTKTPGSIKDTQSIKNE